MPKATIALPDVSKAELLGNRIVAAGKEGGASDYPGAGEDGTLYESVVVDGVKGVGGTARMIDTVRRHERRYGLSVEIYRNE